MPHATDDLIFPETLRLEELREKAITLYRGSHSFPTPLPVYIQVPVAEIDPNGEDHLTNQVLPETCDSGKYSDLVIRCQDREWKVHKAIVCVRSKVLAACVSGPFKESHTGVIDLSEEEPEIVGHMINYLYEGFYDFEIPAPPLNETLMSWIWKVITNAFAGWAPPSCPVVTPSDATSLPTPLSVKSSLSTPQLHLKIALSPSRLMTHASVYCLAELLDLPKLRNYALGRYASLAPSAWKSTFFIPSLKLIYDRTPSRLHKIDDLRAIAARTAAEQSQYFLNQEDFLEACTENEEITTDMTRMSFILRQMEQKVEWRPNARCAVDPKHELVFIPRMISFGMSSFTASSISTTKMQGFGKTTSGKFICRQCCECKRNFENASTLSDG